jgi:hypothetical protein
MSGRLQRWRIDEIAEPVLLTSEGLVHDRTDLLVDCGGWRNNNYPVSDNIRLRDAFRSLVYSILQVHVWSSHRMRPTPNRLENG